MDSKDIYSILKYCSEASIALPIGAGILRFKRLNAGLLILLFYVFLSALVDLMSFIIIHYFKHSNAELFRAYTLIEFVLLTLYFRTLFNRKTVKIFFLVAVLV